MSPSPKGPEEKKLPDKENSSNDDLSHPEFHVDNEHNASTDESANNSDDDDNSNYQNGYCLLPQDSQINQQQQQHENEDEDDEFLRFATLRVQSSMDENKNSHLNNSSNDFIWSSKLESESFPVDDDKANYIKTRMLDIKLPESSIPIWAQYCSEEVWQEKLREKIICRQTTFFRNENK